VRVACMFRGVHECGGLGVRWMRCRIWIDKYLLSRGNIGGCSVCWHCCAVGDVNGEAVSVCLVS